MLPEYTERLMHPKMEYYRELYKDSTKWDGESDLTGKRVIVYAEQGYGDIIQFARYIPMLKAQGCEVFFHCPESLHSLFLENLEGVDGCIKKRIDDDDDTIPEIPQHDYHIPSMSLPFALGTPEADVPYIFMRNGEHGVSEFDDHFKIGIAWEGNPKHSNNDERSCPLGVFKKLYEMDHTKFFMIQQKVQNEKLIVGCENWEILGTELPDFKATAKLIISMDLVISVDTSAMHLAGALGKRTFCLLSYNHDPRWDVEINWYPKTRFITQKFAGDWTGVASELNMHVSMEFQKWTRTNRLEKSTKISVR